MAYSQPPASQGGSPVPISKLSDNELRLLGIDEVIRILRKTDRDKLQAIADKGNIMKDINHKMQRHLAEIREFKDINKRLQEENQELRDLCCFLDDDRQKGRKMAKEWQRFGRYTSSVMKSEVTVYHDKLHELEIQQEELVKENLELKELCLYLDQEIKRFVRGESSLDRDQGDGSSNSSLGTGEKVEDPPTSQEDIISTRNIWDDQTSYIRKLEEKIAQLELEKKTIAPSRINPALQDTRRFFSSPNIDTDLAAPSDKSSPLYGLSGKPEAVAQAMKVLEVHEHLESPSYTDTDQAVLDENLDESEKALIRQMCNVVWKKLGEEVPGYNNAARF